MAESMMNLAPTLETSNTTHSLKTNKIIPIDFKSVLQIPDSHSWSLSEDPPLAGLVPIIDLRDPTIDLEGHIRDACEKWGAFQVINHGVSTNLLEKIEDQARRLFTLPFEQKIRAARTEDGLGGYGMARIARFFPKMMWSEGFTMAGSPEEHARQLWPHDYSTFCHVMEDYQKEMKVLADRILGLLLSSLGLKTEDVNWLCPNSGSKHPLRSILQLNSYPVCPDPSQAMGLAPHTDSSMLTLLYQSNISGLQVHCGKSGGWVTMPPLADGLVVNLGDLMTILSNGKFKSALHRAIVNKAQHRISVACFFSPPLDVKISPLIKLTDPDHPSLYRSVTSKEYLDVKAVYFNKSLDLIRL